PAASPLPTVMQPAAPDEARQGIPRVDDADVTPPVVTVTTVLDGGRPAVVVILPEAVLFAFGSSELRPEATPALTAVLGLCQRRPHAQVDVAGHTDAVGTPEHNLALSQRRAAAVAEWLVDHGVAPARLHAAGYGSSRPVAGNATEDDRRRNRRVDVTVS
ncbi:MAG TPA: OmpA family protein, partial [Acidimicrobiales bacterium]|nr:OmpA family protein [Acidimicrobiales bacterium]